MQNRTPQISGVTCVKGVIESLKPSIGGAFSHITQLHKAAYTNAKLHQWCNALGCAQAIKNRWRDYTSGWV
ncbi:hypothetical protein [Pseudomonas spirodelae]|uniref:Transposase n=1 Tax=Pseudomonas spirodelae TaxID=3101751 RepID=A0ABU5PBJ6_9PSED|nr:hypothetical protein [Pseudomonas sp. T5W1]MEA1606883.1 hypothetical protein [Pseudomonas sp. T5W1]